MARARSFKPELLIDERLVACSMAARWLYVGMGTEADREGRLEDRPMRLKLAIFPGDAVEVEPLLNELDRQGLILRYDVAGKRYIQILDWDKLQSPHIKESASTIPAPTMHGASTGSAPDNPVQAPAEHGPSTVPAALTSDSGLLTLDSGPLTTDPSSSADPASQGSAVAPARQKKVRSPKSPVPTAATWEAYRSAYAARYGVDPVRNATVSAQLAQFVARIPGDEAPQVASFYVDHAEPFYVRSAHSVGLLLRDAEKLRTEWKTGHRAFQAVPNKQEALEAPNNAVVQRLIASGKRSRHSGFSELDYTATEEMK